MTNCQNYSTIQTLEISLRNSITGVQEVKILITGANTGIGFATAEQLVKQGKHVIIRGWRFDLPPAMTLIKQIIISILDLSTVALVLYLLLPTGAHISYWSTFSAFIQSMAVGILSHVPGGLGVFEVTMIAALPQVDRTQMLAVLLVFRVLYYIVPFLLALILLVLYFLLHYHDKSQHKAYYKKVPNNRK